MLKTELMIHKVLWQQLIDAISSKIVMAIHHYDPYCPRKQTFVSVGVVLPPSYGSKQ